MLLLFVKESGITLEIIESKERGTPSRQRDPRNTLYIYNIELLNYIYIDLNNYICLIFRYYK